jgi:hypothetical protein
LEKCKSNEEIRVHQIIIHVLHPCGSVTVKEEHRLMVFEIEVLRGADECE